MRRFLGWQARYDEARTSLGRNRSICGLGRDGRFLTIATTVLMRRFLGWQARYGETQRNFHESSGAPCPNEPGNKTCAEANLAA